MTATMSFESFLWMNTDTNMSKNEIVFKVVYSSGERNESKPTFLACLEADITTIIADKNIASRKSEA